MNDAIKILGIANKAGKIEAGEEPCGAAARARWAKAIFAACDAADNTLRRAKHFSEIGNCEFVVTPFSKDDIGTMIGRTSCAVLAVCDAGFAALLLKKLAEQEPEKYSEAAERLKAKSDKALQRKKEKRAHEKNVKMGKKK